MSSIRLLWPRIRSSVGVLVALGLSGCPDAAFELEHRLPVEVASASAELGPAQSCGNVDPFAAATQETSEAGALSGNFGIDSTGAATYTLPLDVPDGRAEMQPSLALSYSSNARDGSLGVGWSVSGLSSITRCAPTVAQDGYAGAINITTEDRFCLDGKRLVAINGEYGRNGTEYRLEEDQHLQIFSRGSSRGGAPADFEVRYPDGRIASYGFGYTEDIRRQYDRNANGAKINSRLVSWKWDLARIEDRYGNYVSYSYATNDPIDEPQRIVSIEYTGGSNKAPRRKVEFHYENRPLDRSQFIAGTELRLTKRLRTIAMHGPNAASGFQHLWSYELDYEESPTTFRSRLWRVSKCDSAGDCLQPTTFEWTDQEDGFDIVETGITDVAEQIPYGRRVYVMDLNGDGRSDVLYETSALPQRWHIRFGSEFGLSSRHVVNFGYEVMQVRPIDYDGNGFTELAARGLFGDWGVFAWSDSQNSLVRLDHLGHQSNTFSVMPRVTITNGPVALTETFALGDLNSDGSPDILQAYPTQGDGAPSYLRHRRNTGSDFGNIVSDTTTEVGVGSPMTLIEWDGDPGPEVLYASPPRIVDLDQNNSLRIETWIEATGTDNLASWALADINGDGLSDKCLTETDQPICWLGTGRGLASWYPSIPANEWFKPWFYTGDVIGDAQSGIHAIDYNGDGLSDLFVPGWDANGNQINHFGVVYISDGTRFHREIELRPSDGYPEPIPGSAGFNTLQPGDFDGDGLTDIFMVGEGANGAEQAILLIRRGPKGDMISAVENGFTARTEIEYRRLVEDSDFYSSGGTYCDHPLHCVVRGPMVVSAYNTSDGIGGMRRFERSYENARTDFHGRGWLGFESVTTRDLAQGSEETVRYRNWIRLGSRYPFAHRPWIVETKVQLDDGTVYRRRREQWYQRIEGFGGATYRVRRRQLNDIEYEKRPGKSEKAIRSTISKTTEFDDFDNPLRNEVSTSGAGEHIVVRAYQNNTNNWILGLVTREDHTSVGANNEASTRTTEFYYTGQGALRKRVLAPGSQLQRSTELIRDSDGQVYRMVARAPGVSTRTTQLEWDSYDQVYLHRTTNPAGHIQRAWTHPGLGVVTHAEDENGFCTRQLFDRLGRLRKRTDPTGLETTQLYQRYFSGQVGFVHFSVKTSDNTGRWHYADHNKLGRLVRERYLGFSGEVRRVIEYDPLGRIARSWLPVYHDNDDDPVPADMVYEYDNLNRPIRETHPQGTRRWSYEALKITATNEVNQRQEVTLNAVGNPIRSKRLGSNAPHDLRYEYGPFDQLRFVTRGSSVVENRFDPDRGFLIWRYDPDRGIQEHRYNGFGARIETTDSTTGVERFTRDKLDRVIRIDNTDGQTRFGYDAGFNAVGRLAYASSPDGVAINYFYNEQSLLSRERWRVDGKGYDYDYEYDHAGRPSRTYYPVANSGRRLKVDYEYRPSGSGHLYRVLNADTDQPIWTAVSINAEDRRTQVKFGNELRTFTKYEPRTGRVERIETGVSTSQRTTVQNLHYFWQENGLLERREDRIADRDETFFYDAYDRLTKWSVLPSGQGRQDHRYKYDRYGNLTDYDGIKQTYGSFGAAHQLVKSGSDTTFEYDDRGRMLRGGGNTFTYTTFDLPRTISGGGENASFRYNALKQRTVKQGSQGKTTYIGSSYEKREKDGNVEHVYHVNGIAQISWLETSNNGSFLKSTRYLHSDHLGSVQTVTDESGDVVERRAYTPFGRRMTEDGVPITTPVEDVRNGYTGHEHDAEFGLINMNGRIYDPGTGRMLTPDPIVSDFTNGETWNPYSYVSNSPLSFTDPSGFRARGNEDFEEPNFTYATEDGPGDSPEGDQGCGCGEKPPQPRQNVLGRGDEGSSSTGSSDTQASSSDADGNADTETTAGSADGLSAPTPGDPDKVNGVDSSELKARAFGRGFAGGLVGGALGAAAIGAIALASAPAAVAVGIGLTGYGIYELATGGAEAIGDAVGRIATGEGTVNDFELVGTLAGGVVGGLRGVKGIRNTARPRSSANRITDPSRQLPSDAGPVGHISPAEVIGKTPAQIHARAQELGLRPGGPDPAGGIGSYYDPRTGTTRVLSHPNDSSLFGPHGHVNNIHGQRIGPSGAVVPKRSAAAHLPIRSR